MKQRIWYAILALLGILLRIVPVWAMPTWYDENFTILLARLPFSRMVAATAGDVHPPLWYLICWPLAQLPGLQAWAVVRIPSLLASIAAIWVWWLILKIIVSTDRTRIVAFGLFCFLPQQIYYAQEGRMYTLLTLLVLSAWLCILNKKWIWLSVATALMLYLHNYGLIYAAVLWLSALVHDRRNWIPLTISLATSGLTFIPWMLILRSQMDVIDGSYWIIQASLPAILGALTHTFFAIATITGDMLNITVFYGFLTWVAIWSIRHKSQIVTAVILAFLPITIAAVISATWQPIILHRALIPSAAFLSLLFATPVEYLGRKPLLVMAIFFVPALVVNLASTTFRSWWADQSINSDNTVVTMIDSQWREGDLLYYVNDGVYVSGSVSWVNIDNAIRVVPCGPVLGGLSPTTRSALGMQVGPLPDLVTGRIWVITAETPLNPTCENDYLVQNGLLTDPPLICSQDNTLVKSCVYLVEQ